MTMCPCGRPLHYSNPALLEFVERIIADLGETERVTIEPRTWAVPRHYIALHGLIAKELPELAILYGFKEVHR